MAGQILREIFGETVGAEVGGIFPSAMPALTHPKLDAALAARVPGWETAILAALPRDTGDAADCVRAGLWLLAGDMDRAHKLCQDVPSALGSAWHAHLHRREPDFFNSLYWWRRVSGLSWALPGTTVGDLVAARLNAAALAASTEPHRARWSAKLARGVYDPADLVSAVEGAEGAEDAWLDVLRDVQRAEWLGLMYESVRRAG